MNHARCTFWPTQTAWTDGHAAAARKQGWDIEFPTKDRDYPRLVRCGEVFKTDDDMARFVWDGIVDPPADPLRKRAISILFQETFGDPTRSDA